MYEPEPVYEPEDGNEREHGDGHERRTGSTSIFRDWTQLAEFRVDIEGMDEEPRLDHERLDVYNTALEFWIFAQKVIARVPAARKEMRDQLERAAMSIPLNIAEASGKPSKPDRARFFSTARGSALECGAILDVLALSGLLPKDQLTHGKQLLLRIVAMLTKLCR